MKLYVEVVNDYKDILNVSTLQQGATMLEVNLIDADFYFDKLQGYVIEKIEDFVYDMHFEQDKYDRFLEEENKAIALKEAEAMKESLTTEYILFNATDEEAYIMRFLYDEWEPDTTYKVDARTRYMNNLYKCKQNHTSQAQHTPDLLPALWDLINPDEEAGTLDNPIVIPEPFSSMVYVKGKYYKEEDKIYLMNRDGMEDGAEISLTYKPSALVGQYFKLIEE